MLKISICGRSEAMMSVSTMASAAEAVGVHHAAVLAHGCAQQLADARGLRSEFQVEYVAPWLANFSQ